MTGPTDLDSSARNGPHALLAGLAGRWEGAARLWLEPRALAAEDRVTGEIVAVGTGRWVRHDYATRIDGVEHTGSALLGFHLADRVWQVAWVDTFHTGTEIMVSEGPLAERPPDISVLGSYGERGGERWGWRTTLDLTGDALVVRHFNAPPGGDEALAVEFDYTRAPRPRTDD